MSTYNVWHVNEPVQIIRHDTFMSLELMQKIVGGNIEIFKAGKTFFIMNEDGLLNDDQPNPAFPCFLGTIITTLDGMET